MVESIIVQPGSVRARGNVCEGRKSVGDYTLYNSNLVLVSVDSVTGDVLFGLSAPNYTKNVPSISVTGEDSIDLVYGDSVTVTGTVSNVNSGTVCSWSTGYNEGTTTLGTNGAFTITFTPTSRLEWGIILTVPETELNTAETELIKFLRISQSQPALSVLNTTVVRGNTLNVQLLDHNSNPVPGKDIVFMIASTNYTKTTDENGIARLTINLSARTMSCSFVFYGDDDYELATTTASVTVTN